jgi:type I restriction enzyme S subunit
VSWRTVALGDVCKVIAGQSPEGKYYNNDGVGIPFYQGKKDFGKVYINPPSVWTTEITKEAIKDDILMSVRAPVGPVNISIENICIGRGLAAIRSSEKIDKSYLFNYLLSIEKDLIGSSGAVFNSINKGQIEKLEIPLPPLATQKKIVTKLDAIFAEIDKATAAAEVNAKNAEALFQSYLKRIFECDDEGWKEVTIGSLYKVASSKRVLKSDWKSEGVPFYRGREITSLSKFGYVENDLFITEKMYSEYSLNYGVPSAGDIMVTAIGTIGNTYIVKNHDKFYFKDASVLWLKKEKDVESKYVNYWFKSSHFTSQLDVGLGATVDTLTIGKVGGLRIKIPTLNTQADVVAKLDALSSEINKSKKSYIDKANELATLRQSVLRQAFSGELVKE